MLVGWVVALIITAQVPAVLSREDFVRIVLDNHPLARQAALRTGMGEGHASQCAWRVRSTGHRQLRGEAL